MLKKKMCNKGKSDDGCYTPKHLRKKFVAVRIDRYTSFLLATVTVPFICIVPAYWGNRENIGMRLEEHKK